MNIILFEVSVGEPLDKISILEIKKEKINKKKIKKNQTTTINKTSKKNQKKKL